MVLHLGVRARPYALLCLFQPFVHVSFLYSLLTRHYEWECILRFRCARSLYSDPASLQFARLYNTEFVPMIVRVCSYSPFFI